jgi:ribonuclease BN (tRNA processing enzyme)
LVRTPKAAVLLDLGSGSAGKLRLSIEYASLDAVVISHMHADHFFDLVPLRYALKYGDVRNDGPVRLWVPPGGATALDALRKAVSTDTAADFFDGVFTVDEYDPSAILVVGDMRLGFARTRHYVDGYAIRVQHNGIALTYSADTAPCDTVVDLAGGSALFLCEAALGLDTEEGQRGHSSAQEAGAMAALAGVERLVITHYPARFAPDRLVAAAQARFGGRVEAARDGLELEVP